MKVILPLLASAGLLALLLSRVPFREIWAALYSADLRLAGLALLVQCTMLLLTAERNYRITRYFDLELTRHDVRNALLAANFYGIALPGQAPAAILTLHRYHSLGASIGTATAALTMSRSCEVLAFVLLGIAFAMHDIRDGGLWLLTGLLLPGVILALLIAHWIGARVARLRLYAQQARRAAPLGVSLGIAHVFLAGLAMTLFARAINIELGFGSVLWMTTCIYLITLLPISIAGIGVRDASLVLMTEPFGISASAAIAWSFLILAGRLSIGLVGAVAEFRRSVRSGRDGRVSRNA